MKKLSTAFFFLLIFTGIDISAQKADLVSVNQLVVVANNPGPVISKDVYGHFSEHLGACIYGGIWVGKDSKIPNTYGIRNDVLFALREIKVPNLRWPGGCFADTYHWKDGIGPQEKRASIVNTHWGGVTEQNCLVVMHTLMAMLVPEQSRRWLNGWSISHPILIVP
jgi:alpha-N-arabinofuranosidase